MIVVGKELVEMAVKSDHSGIGTDAQNLLMPTLNAFQSRSDSRVSVVRPFVRSSGILV